MSELWGHFEAMGIYAGLRAKRITNAPNPTMRSAVIFCGTTLNRHWNFHTIGLIRREVGAPPGVLGWWVGDDEILLGALLDD